MIETSWWELTKALIIPVILYWLSKKLDKRNKRNSLLCSLYAEVQALIDLIQDRLNSVQNVSGNDKPFVYLPITQNYFSVYDGLVENLSVLKSDKLINKVIATYMETKGLFDDVKGFSDNSMEIKKAIAAKDGNISQRNAVFLTAQAGYFDSIVKVRAPKILGMLNNLKKDIENERKKFWPIL